MKLLIILSSLFLTWINRLNDNDKLLTTKYAGEYYYGNDIEKGRVGWITVYPETDSTILFYIGLNRGAPNYNMGALYGRVKIIADTGTFYTKFYGDEGCKLHFQFYEKQLSIRGDVDEDNCGFGGGVYADGDFKRTSYTIIDSFTNSAANVIYFNKTSPEEYRE